MPDDRYPDPRGVFAADETPSGTTAFLQALMSMLGEVLDRVDMRLCSLEETLAARTEPEPARAGPEATESVLAVLSRISERLERLEGREPAGTATEVAISRLADMSVTRLSDLSSSMDDVGRRLASLAELTAVSTQAGAGWPDGLRESLDALGEGIAGVRAQVNSQGSQSADERSREMGIVVAILDRLGQRLEQLEERDPAKLGLERASSRLDDLSAAVDDAGRRLAGLGEGIAAIRDQVSSQGATSADERHQEVTNLSAALARISERLERLEAREPAGMATELAVTRLSDLSSSVDDLGRRLEGLVELTTASAQAEAEWPEELHLSLAAIGEGIAAVSDQVTSQGSESAGVWSREITTIVAAVEGLGPRLEQLEERIPAKVGLDRAVSRLDDLSAAVDSIGHGLAGMADLMTASTDEPPEWPEGLRAALLALGEGMVELRQDLQGHPVAELRLTVRRLEGQLTLLTNQLASQPGPGPAVAMVAAGLAERFEERTQALTELLGTHAGYVRQTWERIEGMLDGGGFDELAVGEALEHVIDNQEHMAQSVELVVGRLEDLHARPTTSEGLPRQAQEALEALGTGMEGVGVRVDDVRRRLAALARALQTSRTEAGPETEAGDPVSLRGGRGSGAGRRLASDLGLRGRGRPPRAPGA